jgi:hypothetical protein
LSRKGILNLLLFATTTGVAKETTEVVSFTAAANKQ